MSVQAKALRQVLDDIWLVIEHAGFSDSYLQDASGLSHTTIWRTRMGMIDHRFSTVLLLAKAVGMEVRAMQVMAQPQRKRA